MWPAMLTMAMALLVFGGNKVKKMHSAFVGRQTVHQENPDVLKPAYQLIWLILA
jgi:hypothetical protein